VVPEDFDQGTLLHRHIRAVLEVVPEHEPKVTCTDNVAEIAWGGEMGLVLLVTAEALEVRLPTVEWTGGPHVAAVSSVLRERFEWDDSDTTWIQEAIDAGLRARRRQFRRCKYCGERYPPEHRIRGDVCHGCAEAHEHVTF